MFRRLFGLNSTVLSAEKPWIGERLPSGRMVTSASWANPVAPDAVAVETFQADRQLLIQHGSSDRWHADTAANRTVSLYGDAWPRRIDAVAEEARNAEDFIMLSRCRLRNQLGDHVRGKVEGVVCGRVVESAARSTRTNQDVGGQIAAAWVQSLGILCRST